MAPYESRLTCAAGFKLAGQLAQAPQKGSRAWGQLAFVASYGKSFRALDIDRARSKLLGFLAWAHAFAGLDQCPT
jgi:hypothetical protein